MATGTLEWFSRTRGFGYISQDTGGKDLIVRRRGIPVHLYDTLRWGDRVEFRHDVEPEAIGVDVIGLAP